MRDRPFITGAPGSISGFTLIELVAVISIISLMLFFSLPRLENSRASGDMKSVSRWVLANVQSYKKRAVSDQKQYALRISFSENSFSLWDVSSQQDDETEPIKEYLLPKDVSITNVEFPGKGAVSSGNAEIYFYTTGYSDKALLHLTNEGGTVHSLLIEPFLPRIKLYEEYVSFF